MKTFEHEVLTFNASNRKGYVAMQETLREWGAAGYEIVSVTNDSFNASHYVVFLKRETNGSVSETEDAA